MSTLLPLPKRPKSCVFRLVANSQAHTSKANNATEVYDNEGAYWEFDLVIENVKESDALALDAFIASLRGQVGSFTLFDYRREQSEHDFTALVHGDNQDGNILSIKGLAPNKTLLRAGERIQIDSGERTELKILTQNITSNAQGHATIVFESPVRKIPSNNTTVYFKQPRGLFRLTDNKQGVASAKYKNGIVTSWRIKGREAF